MSLIEERIFEKLCANVEVLCYIFELLDLEEQLKFASVCQHFYYFFRRFICKDVYRKILILKTGYLAMIRNEQTLNVLTLTHQGLEYFVNVYADDVEELVQKHGDTVDVQDMSNLKSISYNHMIITNAHLEALAKYCPKLHKLHIYGCCNKDHNVIRLGQDLNMTILLEMPMLKQFTLKNATEFRGKKSALYEVIAQLKLKFYILKMSMIGPEQDHNNTLILPHENNLEELDIYGSFQSSYWSWNLITYLPYFENLHSLTIIIADIANDEVLTALASSCKKLRKMYFRFTTFDDVQSFVVLESLTDLSFHWCKGLTYDNLKDILSNMQLVTFSSTFTKYQGLFQYYFISPTLKSIQIDAFHSFEFRSA